MRQPQFIDAEFARDEARRRLPRMMFDFVDGATGNENAKQNNERALQSIKLQSRILVDVETIDLSTSFLGQCYAVPFGIAPMGMCNLIWPGADAAIAAEAQGRNLPHCISTAASTTLEEAIKLANGNAWFQLYAGSQAAATNELVDRAAAAGYDTLVFTVDTPSLSRRNRDIRNGFQVPLKIGPRQFMDFAMHPRWSVATMMAGPPKPMNFETSKGNGRFVRNDSRGGADWALLDCLRRRWHGRLIVKGVMSAADAVRVRDAGADAVYVSNHGGRQLDSAAAAIDVLPVIRSALGSAFPIVFDSGVRSGDDIVRALALGADFVMLGRPILYALGAGSGTGLNTFLTTITDDVATVLAQLGLNTVNDITSDVVVNPPKGS